MNAATDQAYLDAKLESFSTKVLGEVRAIVAEQAERQKSFELRVEASLQDLRAEIANFASTQDKKFDDFSAAQDRKFEAFAAAQGKKFEDFTVTMLQRFDEFSAAQNKRFDDFSAAQDRKFEAFVVAQDKKFDDFTAAQNKKFEDFTAAQNKKFEDFTVAQNKKFDEFTASQRIQFAEANATLQTNSANSFKWMMGAVVAMCAVWIGSVNLIISRPVAASTPIVIYAQPAPIALAPAAR